MFHFKMLNFCSFSYPASFHFYRLLALDFHLPLIYGIEVCSRTKKTDFILQLSSNVSNWKESGGLHAMCG